MGRYVSSEELPNILHQLQFASLQERMIIFDKYITDKVKCEQLKQLFTQDAMVVKYKDMKDNKLNLPEEYIGIYKMGEGLSYITNNTVYFDAKDLHSIETVDNFALRFRTLDGIALGDGGEYTQYAQRWNDKIQSFWSVASGVEAIERNSPEMQFESINRKIALYSIDATPEFVLKVIKKLEDMGENISYKGSIRNVGKAIKKVQDEYSHIVILGSNEENGQDIRIKSIMHGEEQYVESPNKKKVLVQEESYVEEER